MIDLKKIDTEKVNQNSVNLSSMTIREAVELFNNEDYNAVKCIESEYEVITRVIEKTTHALSNGGRIIYIGAGTSGRLGLIDAVECPPTFGVDYNTVVGVIAGGNSAFVKAKEGAEDSNSEAIDDLRNIDFNEKDILVGIAASGRTPYVIGGLKYAEEIGAETAAVVCTRNSEIAKVCKDTIEAVPGPEVLTGSTRLKAGTSTKLVLNMISTISMIGQGKIYKNYMVDVKMSNKKLVQRGINIIKEVTGCIESLASEKLKEADNSVKTAIVMILLDCGKEEAESRLSSSRGSIDGLLHN